MFSTSNTTLPVLILGLIIGVSVLVLIANELGKRTSLSIPARLLLSGGLGMGVLSVGIKVVIVSVLSQVDGQALAATGAATRVAIDDLLPDAQSETHEETVSARPSGFRTWRALPDAPPEPRANRTTPTKIELGRLLFHDENLSLDRSLSCASCHTLADGGDDNAQFSTGFQGHTGDRNAPTVLNAAFLRRLFWDGRARSLEHQAEGPFVNPVEMAMPSLGAVEERVREDPTYGPLFQTAFPGSGRVSIGNITKAIAAYERTLITPDTPYDRYVKGDDTALAPAALRGMILFDEIGCRNCHMDPVFSAAGTEKTLGIYRTFPVFRKNNPFLSKYGLLVSGKPARFRVPSLRNVALTAPYFHNGSVGELEEAIRIMAVSQLGRKLSSDPLDDLRVISQVVDDTTPGRNTALIRNRAVSEQEVLDIAAFLRSLSATSIPE